MKTVWKFVLAHNAVQAVSFPAESTVLTVQVQFDRPCIWVLLDPAALVAHHTVTTVGTGHPVPDDAGSYVGSYQLDGGRFVGHVFVQASVRPA